MLMDISISKRKKKAAAPPLKKGESRIVRSFEDGAVEIEDAWGRRRRGKLSMCSRCSIQIFGVSSFIGGPIHCVSCADTLRREHKERVDLEYARRRLLMLENGETSPQRRRSYFFFASVKWRDRAAIREIYIEARKKTEETGIPHHVDHIYPIQGLLGCGLHVPCNLQVMVGSENCSKGNGFPLDQSPAWDDCDMAEIHRETLKMIREYEEGLDKGPKACAISSRS